METITLTSKRQATFPVKLCEELGVGPGDKLRLGRRMVEGKPAWVIHVPGSVDMSWLGALKEFAVDKSHDMNDIRRSIGQRTGERK